MMKISPRHRSGQFIVYTVKPSRQPGEILSFLPFTSAARVAIAIAGAHLNSRPLVLLLSLSRAGGLRNSGKAVIDGAPCLMGCEE